MEHEININTIMLVLLLFIALWWVSVNVPEFFTTAVIYMMAILIYIPLSISEIVPVITINTENIIKQLALAIGISLIIAVPSLVKVGSIFKMSLSPISIFFIVAVAPIVEEMFFRGLLFPVISEKTNVIIGIIATSLIFALFHYSIYGSYITALMWLILLSIINCFLVLYTKSLIPAIILHMLNNAIAITNFTISSINVGLIMALLSPLVLIFRKYDKLLPLLGIITIGISLISSIAILKPMIVIDTLLYYEKAGLVFIVLLLSGVSLIILYYMKNHYIDTRYFIISTILIMITGIITIYNIIDKLTLILIITAIPIIAMISQYNKI